MRLSKNSYFNLYGGASFPDANRLIQWTEAFTRSGFLIRGMGEPHNFDVSFESRENLDLLIEVFRHLGIRNSISSGLVHLVESEIIETVWLHAIEKHVDGVHEGDWTGTPGIKLWMLDPYIAGVVRWVNCLGIKTILSCDGHGTDRPRIDLEKITEGKLFNAVVVKASRGDWEFRSPRNLIRVAPSGVPDRADQRYSLLKLAQTIYEQKVELKNLIRAERKV